MELIDLDAEQKYTLLDNADNTEKESKLYEKAIDACGFGVFHVIIVLVSGWALISDSVEIQVVSFVLPSACDLAMTSHQKGWLNAIIIVGMLLGGYLFGGAADVKGRRHVLLWSMTVNGLSGLASAFAPNFAWFLSLRLLSGIGVGATLPIIFTYCAEFMSTTRRGPAIACLASFWMMGNILTCAFAWMIIPRVDLATNLLGFVVFTSWRAFVLIGALPSLSSAMLMYFMPESPMYLQKRGKYDEAVYVFIRMFKRNYGNGSALPREIKEFSDFYKASSNVHERTSAESRLCMCSEFIKTLLEVVKSTKFLFLKPLGCTTVILITIWCTLSFGYYGLWMWLPEIFKRIESGGGSSCTNVGVTTVARNVSFNFTCVEKTARGYQVYTDSFAIAISNLPGNLLTIALVNRVGRRPLMAISMILSGTCVFFLPLVSTHESMIALLCVFSGMSVIGWNVLDMLAIEHYPTDLRSTAYGVQAMFGRIAAICGNVVFGVLVDEHCAITVIVVAVLLAVGGLSTLKLPKTDDKPLS